MEHQPTARRGRVRTALAGMALTGLLLGATVPASAAPTPVAATASSQEGIWKTVKPAVAVGGNDGVQLKAGKAKGVKFKRTKGLPKSARSLVVQVDVLDARKAGTLSLGRTASAAVSYPKGNSSTTSLLTIPASRSRSFTASSDAKVRVSVIGYIKGERKGRPVAGGTRLLPPTKIVDTTTRLLQPTAKLPSTLTLKVAGTPSVPSKGVRAVWLSVQAKATGKATVSFAGSDGERSSTSVASVDRQWSTSLVLAPLDELGNVTGTTKGANLNAMRVTLLGWVAGSTAADTDSTRSGGIVVVDAEKVHLAKGKVTSSETRYVVRVKDTSAVPANASKVQVRVTVATKSRSGSVKVATSSSKSAWRKAQTFPVAANTVHQFLTTAPVGKGGKVHVAVPKGAKVRDVAVVGYVATKVAKSKDKVAPSLTVSSPKDATTIEGDRATVTFSGKVSDTGSGVRRVQVKEGSTLVATAVVDHARGVNAKWDAAANVKAGKHTFTITATDWAGRSTSVKRTVTVKAPTPNPTPSPTPSPSPSPDDDEDEDEAVTPAWVWAWGDNQYGLTASGATFDAVWSPQLVVGQTEARAVKVKTGVTATLMLDTDGGVWGWGDSQFGALQVPGATVTYPIRQVGLPEIVDIAEARNTSYALDRTGQVWSWGYNAYRALGREGVGLDAVDTVPGVVEGLPAVKAIFAGKESAAGFAVDLNGELWGWGALGLYDSGLSSTAVPQKIPGMPSGVKVVDAYDGQALIVLENGELWAWGWNTGGDDQAVTFAFNPPYKITALDGQNVVDASVGTNGSFYALTELGDVWLWGHARDKLSLGREAPEKLDYIDGVAQVETSSGLAAFRLKNGEVWVSAVSLPMVFGVGEPPTPFLINTDTAVQVPGITNAIDVAAGYNAVVALVPAAE